MRIVRLVVVLATLVLATSCGLLDEVRTSTSTSTGQAPVVSSSTSTSTDQADDLGVEPRRDGGDRLTPLPPQTTAASVAVIDTLPTQGRGPKTGYRRDLFGDAWDDEATGVLWSHNGCRMMVIWMSRGSASANAQVEMRFEVGARVCHVSDEEPSFPDELGPIMLGSAGPRVRPGARSSSTSRPGTVRRGPEGLS